MAPEKRQHGLSIIELMIALVLGIFLLGGVVYIYLATSQTYRLNESLSRVQESGRFATEFLSSDIRPAGFRASCGVPTTNLLNTAGTGWNAEVFGLNPPVMGWNDAAPPAVDPYVGNLVNYRANTDTLLVKHAAIATDATASSQTSVTSNVVNLSAQSGIPLNAIVLLAETEGCALFQNRSNATDSALSRTVGDWSPGNCNPAILPNCAANLPMEFTTDVEIRRFRSALYYVGDDASGFPTLRRVLFDEGVGVLRPIQQELVEGIIDMQVCYGVDTNRNQSADVYQNAANVPNWANVVSVRITFVAIDAEPNVATEVQNVTFTDCDGTTPIVRTAAEYPELAERRLARVFNTTIGLRNNLP